MMNIHELTPDDIHEMTDQELDELEKELSGPEAMIAALTALKKAQESCRHLQKVIAVKNQQIAEMKPMSSYYDCILLDDEPRSAAEVAKDFGMTRRQMNHILRDLGIQHKQEGAWLLEPGYADQGYTQTRILYEDGEDIRIETLWTQKGRLFLYHLLMANGLLKKHREACI